MEFTEPVMRPPQESGSLILRVTQGCTYNKCNFCYVSRGYPFMDIDFGSFEAEVARASRHYQSYTAIYLAGANPFSLPAKKLEEYARILRKYFPSFSRISMQSRIDDIAAKSAAELLSLREAGIRHIYTGTENGNEEVLAIMNKGHTAEDTVAQLRRLHDAGITCTAFYVLGLGGKGRGIASGRATAEMFNRAGPDCITTTGMTLFEAAPVADMARRGEFVEAPEKEKMEELLVFLEELKVDAFYDGVHYLNPLNYRFDNRDKETKQKVLADIRDILATHTDDELELMVNRRQMQSL